MCRQAKSVERLWQEWTAGLNGQASVSALDSRWGSRWRAGRQRELQWYSLRLEVIREIRRRAKAQRSSEEQAMWSLHLQQQQMGCSLDRLCKQLRAGRSGNGRQAGGQAGGRASGRYTACMYQ
jgi:Transcriptional activator of glycolytic enzymes